MHQRGPASWRLHTPDQCWLLEHALRVRDVCGLRIASPEEHPPAVCAVDAAAAAQLSGEERAQAEALWPMWWRTCVSAEFARQLADGPWVDGVWREDLNQAVGAAGDPPFFPGLGHRPALQRAAQVTWLADQAHPPPTSATLPPPGGRWGDGDPVSEMIAWLEQHSEQAGAPILPEPLRELSAGAWQLVSTVAHHVIATHGVPAPEVQAWLLPVPGTRRWWRVTHPGVVVATEAALADSETLWALVWGAFTSRLIPPPCST